MRKLLIATLPCLVLGLASPAFAADGGGHGGGGHGGGGHGAAPHDGGTGTATVDGVRSVTDGSNAEAQLSDRERVDRCPLDAILASDCQPQN